jgi:energy-coupling factor transport system ATP-binding protein
MIRIENVTVRYGEQVALDSVSLHIAAGDFVLITGASGCGKSTLVRCLNGLVPQVLSARLDGSVSVNGLSTVTTPVAELSASVGVVFQNPATQLFSLTVDEEVAFGPRNLGVTGAEVDRRAQWALAACGISGLRGRAVRTLSGGERQRLAIASVLAMEPKVLVLDEPSASLDVNGTSALMATLEGLNTTHGVTVVIVEHRLGEVARLARRSVVMDGGGIVADGPTAAIFADRELLRRLGLRRPAESSQDDWSDLLSEESHPPGRPLVELRNLEVRYGSERVLSGLDLTVHEGEFVALVGDNAAGKTTIARVLAGLMKPARGSVHWPAGRPEQGRGIGLLFQNPLHQLFCDRVEEEVSFGPRNFGTPDPATVEMVLEATGLRAFRHRLVHDLSTGQQQRAALAGVLSLRPRLVILDEPTMGQDWGHLSVFMDFMVALNRAGSTILLISHDYKLVHRYAQRVLLIRNGRVAAEGAPDRRGSFVTFRDTPSRRQAGAG